MEYEGTLVLAITGVIIYLVYDTYFMGNLEYVKSTVDGNLYQVQDLPDKQDAADLLAHIKENLDLLVRHLEKINPSDQRVQRMVANFNSEKISEGVESTKYTSYSVNKGEKIVFCLRSKDANKTLTDLNTMMFVAIHELAHICTKSVGHTEEFWANMKWLLQESIQIGIYKEQDFKIKPQPYCGIQITDSPLNH